MDARTVAVALRLEAGQFVAGLGVAAGRVKAFGAEVQAGAGKAGKALGDFVTESDTRLRKVGTAGLIAGGLVVAGLGLAAGAAMGFDKQMSEVGAVAGATGDQLGLLRDAAIEAGQATVFSASQAASAQAELAKAGVSTRDILAGGLTGALNLASAGSLDLATAAELAANAMNIFKLQGADVPHIADVLAAAANKSATDVGELGMALKQGGLVADQYGITLETTAGTLALFAQNGLKGSDAGTSFKTMLQRLTPQSAEAAGMMDQLGISFFDSRGKFVGLSQVAEILKTKLAGLSDAQRAQALQTLFGSDAVRGATILMDGGAAAVDQWTKSVDESGYAAELAATKNDNLAGDLEKLKGSMETSLIQGGSKATDVLRDLAQQADALVNGFSALPGPLQNTLLGVVGLVGAGGAAIGVYSRLSPYIDTAKDALSKMGSAGAATAANFGTMGAAAAGAAIPLALLAVAWLNHAAEMAGNIQLERDLAKVLSQQAGAIDEGTDAWLRRQFVEGDDHGKRLGDTLAGTNVDIQKLTEGIRENGTELDHWRDRIASYDDSWADLRPEIEGAAASGNKAAQVLIDLADNAGLTGSQLENLIRDMDYYNDRVDGAVPRTELYKQLLQDQGVSAEDAASAAGALAGQTAGVGTSMKSAEEKVKDFTSAVEGYFDAVTSGLSANIDFEAAIDNLTDSIREHGNVWQIDTEAGRENQKALIAAKDAAIAHGIEMFNQTGSTEQATAAAMGHVDALRATMSQAGLTDQQIDWLIATMGLTPEAIATQFNVPGLDQATTGVHNLNEAIKLVDGRTVTTYFRVDTSTAEGQVQAFKDRLRNPDFVTVMGMDGRVYTVPQANGGVVDYTAYANGGIHELERYANGGMTRGIAGIAPANSHVLFAETPATGPEAYIPLGPSKRARSRSIWAETGRRLGMDGAAGTQIGAIDNSRTVTVPVTYMGPDPHTVVRGVGDEVMWQMETSR